MYPYVYVVIFVILFTVLQIALHHHVHPELAFVNMAHLLVASFQSINLLICLWELGLYLYQPEIQFYYTSLAKVTKPRSMPPSLFLFRPCSITQALSLEFWASRVWGTYSIFDHSYCECTSFGWMIDVGNAFTTIVPTILTMLGISIAGVPQYQHLIGGLTPRMLGFFSALTHWQELYGTLGYFFSYIHNRRWEKHGNSPLTCLVLVGTTNFVWIMLPAFVIWTCLQMVVDDSLQVFLN